MDAKLSDVGLAHELEGGSHVSLANVMGTTGYIDPLLNDTQRASAVTDGDPISSTLSHHPIQSRR